MSNRVGGPEPTRGNTRAQAVAETQIAEGPGPKGAPSQVADGVRYESRNTPQILKLTSRGLPKMPELRIPSASGVVAGKAPTRQLAEAPTGQHVIDTERAKANARLPDSSSVHQKFDQLDHPDSFRDLVDGIVSLRHRLPRLREPQQVGMAVRGCADRFLRAEGVPELVRDVTIDPSQKEIARFDPETWSVSLRTMPATLDKKASAALADSLAHESRHAEQAFHLRTAMFRRILEAKKASWEAMGAWPPDDAGIERILQNISDFGGDVGVPTDVAKKAMRAAIDWKGATSSRSQSLAAETPKGYRMGAASEGIKTALAAYDAARSKAEEAKRHAASSPSKESRAKATAAAAALEHARKALVSAYARMRADPLEREAYQTGKLAGRAVMAAE